MGLGILEPGGVLLGDSQLYSHQEDSVGGGGGSGLFLIVTPFISFAPLSGLQNCQSRPKLVPSGSCSQRHIQYTTSIGFAFFDSIVGWYIFEMCEDGGIYKRLAISCASWWMFFRNHRGVQIPLPLMQRLNIHE